MKDIIELDYLDTTAVENFLAKSQYYTEPKSEGQSDTVGEFAEFTAIAMDGLENRLVD